jgi:hypothetical protein
MVGVMRNQDRQLEEAYETAAKYVIFFPRNKRKRNKNHKTSKNSNF